MQILDSINLLDAKEGVSVRFAAPSAVAVRVKAWMFFTRRNVQPALLQARLRMTVSPRHLEKTIFPPFASAVIVSPSRKVPARISIESGSSKSRWMARFSGRAPYTGS